MATGIDNVKTDPRPTSLSRMISPCRTSARRRHSESPNPVPLDHALCRTVYLREFLKNAVAVSLRDANARIFHREVQAPGLLRRAHSHLAIQREFQRIGNEVPDDLDDLPFITCQLR